MRLERPSVRARQGVAGGDQRAAGLAPGAAEEAKGPRSVGGEDPLGAEAVDLAIELSLVDAGSLVGVRHVMSPSGGWSSVTRERSGRRPRRRRWSAAVPSGPRRGPAGRGPR